MWLCVVALRGRVPSLVGHLAQKQPCMAEGEPRVYAKIDDVRVPEGVPRGGEFEVALAGRRSRSTGEQTTINKKLWRASGMWPTIVPRGCNEVAGERYSYRPSAQRRASDALRGRSDPFGAQEQHVSNWATTEEMPFETNAADIGWLPGPVGGTRGRLRPRFTGPRPGVPRGVGLNANSTNREIVRSVQLCPRYLQRWRILTVQHCHAWRQTHRTLDSIERAWNASDLRDEHFELWLAARVRIAMLNVAVPAEALWDKSHHLFDFWLAAALPFQVMQWLNRHASFGEYGENRAQPARAVDDAADQASARTATAFDRYVKRRELSDIARAQAAVVWNPHQMLGMDDIVRVTRHRDGQRLRHKAAVHTGRICDALNDTTGHYFLHWEENTWFNENHLPTGANGAPANRTCKICLVLAVLRLLPLPCAAQARVRLAASVLPTVQLPTTAWQAASGLPSGWSPVAAARRPTVRLQSNIPS